ncbi:MAG: DUF86 domain-containing protein [Candidatus Nanohaloarchaea archaeon]|nr:DUF86 domain-containing protein [Candidatus Nanohaloarchaea archaeon]
MKDDTVYLKHIRDAIERIEEYTEGLTEEEFKEDRLVQDGVVRQIEIIGEAAKQLSGGAKDELDDVPWEDVAGMRDKLIHGYFGVDLETVWDTVQEDIPELQGHLPADLNEENDR